MPQTTRVRSLAPGPRIHHAHSMAPARVAVPELVTGARFLSAWPFSGRPARLDWRETHYDSMAPATFVLSDSIVHSSAGLIQIGDEVLSETLWHTVPDMHGYTVQNDGVALNMTSPHHLAGTYVSLLAGEKGNYFHAMIEGVAKLAMLPPHLLEQADGVLLTQGAVAQEFVLERFGLPARLQRRQVRDGEALRVDTLIYPWSVHGDCDFHPCVVDFFERIAAGLGAPARDVPRRIYIDRRGSSLRPLVNEDELIACLRRYGFVAVKPEALSLADQARLFRGAEAVVAPHGAGLTNLGYCRAGTVVLEIFMDAYVNWCFRRLAAVRGLRYDCVLGRAVDAWMDGSADPHALRWRVEPDVVAAAVGFLLGFPA